MTENNRIDQIRALVGFALAHLENAITCDGVDLATEVLQSILDSAPPAPRVFFPGDTVPAGRTVQNVFGETVLLADDIDCATATVVEVPVLTRGEWQAAVDRAREARAIPEPTEGQNRG